MSWPESDDASWDEAGRRDGDGGDPDGHRWPLNWAGLYPRERRLWFEQLWSDVCMLRGRFRLSIRSGW